MDFSWIPSPEDLLWECSIKMAPVAQGRPLFVRATGKAVDPTKSRNAKLLIKSVICTHFAPPELLSGALFVVVGSYILPPKLNKKQTQLATEDKLAPLHKPDTDNYFKGVADACKGVVWTDDSLITDLYSFKRYSYHPRIVIEVYRAKVEGR